MQIFILLLTAGLFLLGAEIFLPGGVLGVLGGLALCGAMIAGFSVFGPLHGAYIALGVIVAAGLGVVFWIRLFPRTRMGRALTLAGDGADCKAADTHLRELAGQAGVAVTVLRPAGIVRVGQRNFDVVSEGPLIERGSTVQVCKVEGNRVVVRKT